MVFARMRVQPRDLRLTFQMLQIARDGVFGAGGATGYADSFAIGSCDLWS